MSQDGLTSAGGGAGTPGTAGGTVSAGKHIPRVARAMLHKGGKYDVELLTARARDGSLRERAVMRHPGAVVILPIEGAGTDRRVILIRSYRLSVERAILELPAGTREGPEDPGACAARELEEETGYVAGSVHGLGSFLTSPGLSDERMWAYVATDLRKTAQRLEADEDITVVPTPVDEVWRLMRTGELEDAKSMVTLLMARERGLV